MSDPPAFDDAQIVYLDEHYSGQSSANVHWMIFNGVLVFLMQCGFAMLCAGSVRAKNAQNILLKNLVDTCVGAMGFWATGYAFAYGDPSRRSRGNAFETKRGRDEPAAGATPPKRRSPRRAVSPPVQDDAPAPVPTCPICLDPTTVTLVCGHAMCEECMGRLAVFQGQTLTRSRRRVVIQCPLRCLAPTERVLA